MPLYLTNPIDGSRWAVVPVKITKEQWLAWDKASTPADEYAAMLAAAPEFPVEAMVEKVMQVIEKATPITTFEAQARAVLAALFSEVKP